MKKNRMFFLSVAVLIAAAGVITCGSFYSRDTTVWEAGKDGAKEREEKALESFATPEARTAEPAPTEEKIKIVVYVCGEVGKPGVYELTEGSRAADAISMAGGLTGKAADSYINQAALLEDGEKLYIPDSEEAKNGNPAPAKQAGEREEQPDKVNLNTAGEERLMTLPGIGRAKAAAIIKYREQNGAFLSTEDIMNIDGIKEGSYKKLKDYITV